jgi:hypothetical protein
MGVAARGDGVSEPLAELRRLHDRQLLIAAGRALTRGDLRGAVDALAELKVDVDDLLADLRRTLEDGRA